MSLNQTLIYRIYFT